VCLTARIKSPYFVKRLCADMVAASALAAAPAALQAPFNLLPAGEEVRHVITVAGASPRLATPRHASPHLATPCQPRGATAPHSVTSQRHMTWTSRHLTTPHPTVLPPGEVISSRLTSPRLASLQGSGSLTLAPPPSHAVAEGLPSEVAPERTRTRTGPEPEA
jgi:hypothetical protein